MSKKKDDLDFDAKKLSLGQAVDKLYELKQIHRERMAAVDAVKEKEKELEDYLIDSLPKSDQTGAVGKLAKATVTVSNQPTVKDWGKVYAYIKKNNRFDMLQRRINAAAVKELWEDGKKIPGVDVFQAKKISLVKK